MIESCCLLFFTLFKSAALFKELEKRTHHNVLHFYFFWFSPPSPQQKLLPGVLFCCCCCHSSRNDRIFSFSLYSLFSFFFLYVLLFALNHVLRREAIATIRMSDTFAVQQKLAELQNQYQELAKKNASLEIANEKYRATIHDFRSKLVRMEDLFAKSQADMAYTQQQLQGVIIGLERQHGIVADHTEQLRLFAGESSKRGAFGNTLGEGKPLLLIIVDWLYSPLVHFVKGLYTLFSPIINTAQSLSLFNSELQMNYSDDTGKGRWWSQSEKGDLLGMLQSGALDPIAARKKASQD